MKRLAIACASLLLLAACGQGSGGVEKVAQGGETCALLSNSEQVFGANLPGEEKQAQQGASGECLWEREDGAVLGNLVIVPNATEATFNETLESWKPLTQNEAAPQPISGLGDQAALVTPMNGYQSQIALRKGDSLALILANSGDDALTSEALARRMAEAIAPNL